MMSSDTNNTTIYRKLLEVKRQVPSITKDEKNSMYSYASPSAVLGTLNPLLNDAGIFLKTEVLNVESERLFSRKKTQKLWLSNKPVEEVVDFYETLYHLDLRFTWIDVDSGETDENLFSASGMNGDEKGLGSALTYAERYFLLKFFNIPTDDDDPDKKEKPQEPQEPQTSKPQQKKKKEESPKTWLTPEQFALSMKSDLKGVIATINKYSGQGFGMKKEYRESLTAKLGELKKQQ